MITNPDTTKALTPFAMGGLEVLFVPNQLNGAQPTVLVVAQQGNERLYTQLTSTEARQLATNLRVAANEADSLGNSPSRPPAPSKLRHGHTLRYTSQSSAFYSSSA